MLGMAIAAAAIGMELDDVFEMNKTKLRERYPDGFSSEKSIHRKEYEDGQSQQN